MCANTGGEKQGIYGHLKLQLSHFNIVLWRQDSTFAVMGISESTKIEYVNFSANNGGYRLQKNFANAACIGGWNDVFVF